MAFHSPFGSLNHPPPPPTTTLVQDESQWIHSAVDTLLPLMQLTTTPAHHDGVVDWVIKDYAPRFPGDWFHLPSMIWNTVHARWLDICLAAEAKGGAGACDYTVEYIR